MHELIQIWKKNANETNLKALNPIIGSFSVKVQVNLLIAYVLSACRLFLQDIPKSDVQSDAWSAKKVANCPAAASPPTSPHATSVLTPAHAVFRFQP